MSSKQRKIFSIYVLLFLVLSLVNIIYAIYSNLTIQEFQAKQIQKQEIYYKQEVKNITEEFIIKKVECYSPGNSDKDNKVIADAIVKQSKQYNIDSLKLLAISLSESGCDVNVKHSSKSVIGICGINSDVWTNELIQNNIISCKEDLRKPRYNIRSMAYIIDKKMNSSNNNFKLAVHKYKGIGEQTEYQVNITLEIYKNLKSEIKEFNA